MTKKIFTLSVFFLISLFFFSPSISSSQTRFIYDWYIKNFESEIIVNKDSSLSITEKITADCDNLSNKHGIFRALPTEIKTDEETIKNPIQLISITDFVGNPIKYSVIKDSINHTITWKIGDLNKIVTGVNYYKITYKVKNTIRFGNQNFDELYWNLNGNFWEIETDNFQAKIIFPPEVTKENSQVDYYTGLVGSKTKNLASYRWIDDNTLQFYSTQPLEIREGITASITFSKNIFSPYKPNIFEKYGDSLWFLLPIFVFIICFAIWWKYGKDPKVNKTIIPEFGIPENLTPIEMGMLINNGKFRNEFISATVINLGVKGIASIKETRSGLFNRKDFLLKDLSNEEKLKNLNSVESLIFQAFFWKGQKEVLLSSLKNMFYQNIPEIKKQALNLLSEKNLIVKKSLTFQLILYIASFFVIPTIFFIFLRSWQLFISALVSDLIILFFSFFMPKRTEKGAELLWKINGFKLYMETAEKYRQQFYEKENIFEKLLPYAIVFGMTKLWIKKMEQIYGEKYFETYHPVWFVGTNLGAFDADGFTSIMNSVSSSISSSTHGVSGAGGGGFAGGGGGGGGGGGW